MRIAITVPTTDPRRAGDTFAALEAAGYDTGCSFEAKHDPFLPLALASMRTERLCLGTAVAIAFARNPMVLANIGDDLQRISQGRFVLGLGSQIRPHIQNRFSETWTRPAPRMHELVRALHAIWDAWEHGHALRFEGDVYRHTLMTPAFDPGPNPYGRPPVFIGGFGPQMIRVAGEVADGLIVHPFNSRRSFEHLVRPNLDEGLARTGRRGEDVEVLWALNIVTWSTDEEHERAIASIKEQFAFYGSTPAYARVLELHGYGELHRDLNALSKDGRWDEMARQFPDALVEELAITGRRDEIASKVRARVDGCTDSIGLVNSRNPDPAHFADIVADLRALDPPHA